jgi:hypothetical protein
MVHEEDKFPTAGLPEECLSTVLLYRVFQEGRTIN